MLKGEPLFIVNVATGHSSLTEQLISGQVYAKYVSPDSRNGNIMKFFDNEFNVEWNYKTPQLCILAKNSERESSGEGYSSVQQKSSLPCPRGNQTETQRKVRK